MLKLLIADAGEEFRQTLAEQVRGIFRVRVCQEGNQTLDMILAFKPDLVVLDMMLPGLDGISILEEAARCGVCPAVLAVTKYPSDYMVEAAARCGVRYMMVKPCNIGATLARLQDLAEHLEKSIANRTLDPFARKIIAQDGTVKNDGSTTLSPEELLHMDWLCDNVLGSIPTFEEILPMSQSLVRELGIYRDSIPAVKEIV